MENLTQTARDRLDIFRVYFFEAPRGNLFDWCFHKGISDYQRMFGYRGSINHCAVQLGRKVYETAMDGTISYEIEPEEFMAVEGRLLGYYELDISTIDEGTRNLAKFYLESDLADDRRWKIAPCISYLYDFMWQNAFGRWDDEQLDYNVPQGHIEQEKGTAYYHLPFTCATLVANVVNILFDRECEPTYDAHLPMSTFTMCVAWADMGVGFFITKEDLTVEVR